MARQKNGFFRGQDGCGLGHKVDAAKKNDIRIGAGGLDAKFQRIPAKVRQFLDFRRLIVMGQQHGIAFFQ